MEENLREEQITKFKKNIKRIGKVNKIIYTQIPDFCIKNRLDNNYAHKLDSI